MRATLSALWLFIGILGAAAAGADALADDCQSGDPYNRPDMVVEACSKLLGAADTDAQAKLGALRQRAEAYYWANRYDFAMADLDAALALDQTSVETLRTRGWTNIMRNRRSEARSDFTEALNLDPQNADTLFAIGFMLHQEGLADAARAAYEQALAINPKQYLAKSALANLYFYYLKDADKALEQTDAVISADPDDVAKTRYKSFRDVSEAIDFYSDERFERAQMLFHLERFEAALEDANWVIDKYPRSAGVLALRADIRRHLRDDANALADADRVLTLAPDQERAQIVKFYSLSRLGRRDELFEFANRVIDSAATDNARGNAYFFRAEVEKKKSNRQAAIADMERSFELAPFFLVATLQRMIARGYYQGTQDDGYGKKARVALEACMIDPEC